MATTSEAIQRAKRALREVVESRGPKSNALDEVTRKALIAFSLLNDAESALLGEGPEVKP